MPMLQKTERGIVTIVNLPDLRERLLAFGAKRLPGTPDDLRSQLARKVPAWR